MVDLTVIVPTCGRPTLPRTLASIPYEIRVLLYHDTSGDLGHRARNQGMSQALSKWIAFMDDDDAYTPDAFQIIEAALDEDAREVPHIFQMRFRADYGYAAGTVLWRERELRFGNVGTPMFVVPNRPERLGFWPSKRGGDFDFIADTCTLMGDPVWNEGVIAEIRPP